MNQTDRLLLSQCLKLAWETDRRQTDRQNIQKQECYKENSTGFHEGGHGRDWESGKALRGAQGRFRKDGDVIIIVLLMAALIESFLCAKWVISFNPQDNPVDRQC